MPSEYSVRTFLPGGKQVGHSCCKDKDSTVAEFKRCIDKILDETRCQIDSDITVAAYCREKPIARCGVLCGLPLQKENAFRYYVHEKITGVFGTVLDHKVRLFDTKAEAIERANALRAEDLTRGCKREVWIEMLVLLTGWEEYRK